MSLDLKQFTAAFSEIAEEMGITPEKILETIEMAIAAAYKKEYGKKGQMIRAKFDPKTGDVKLFQVKLVVDETMLKPEEEAASAEAAAGREELEEKLTESGEDMRVRFNAERHLMVEEAKTIKSDAQPGEELEFELEVPAGYGRIAAQTAKQVIIQRLREAQREAIYEEFKDKKGELVSGMIQRVEGRTVYVDIGKAAGVLLPSEQIPGEFYRVGMRLKFFVLAVEQNPKGPGILLSRAHPKMITKLFELEVPEIASGAVELKTIAREPGSRTKIAVASNEEGVDPVGSCVGQKGTRVSAVISELGGEKIDIIQWDDDAALFIKNALSPAKVLDVTVNEEAHTATVVVPQDQLSLAIGRGGQNVRLAAKLTGWKIDVVGPGGAVAEEVSAAPTEVGASLPPEAGEERSASAEAAAGREEGEVKEEKEAKEGETP